MQELVFQFSSRTTFSNPINDHTFLLRCLPLNLPEQVVSELDYEILPPDITTQEGVDSFGNRTLAGYLGDSHLIFGYAVNGKIIRDDSKRISTEALPCYRYPSRLTKMTAAIEAYARQLPTINQPIAMAKIIQAAVNRWFTYTPGVTGINTTAGDAFALRRGVCQDYTHVFLAIARSLGLSARYVCGLPAGEGATHAWAEVYQDGLWHGFDPTRNCLADESYIKLAVGRDYADCPPERGIFVGCAQQTQTSFMQVTTTSVTE